jgi:4-hydroxybenzoate polyprenyltransferase
VSAVVETAAAAHANLPIVVDLDETLLCTDTLHESFARALFHHPAAAFAAVAALPQGRYAVKAALASRVALDPATLPVRQELLAWLKARAAEGNEIHLCTAAHRSIAEAVASRIGMFSSVVGSDGTNLKGAAKAEALARRFPDGFIYAGDSPADLEVWRRASSIVLVNATAATAMAARALDRPVLAEFKGTRASLRDWVRAIRAHHWSKNMLVFVPLILGHGWRDPTMVLQAVLGFALLLLLTSSTYLLNDVADLRADRLHWSKQDRPIASGRIPIRHALGAGLGGIAFALLGGLAVSPALFMGLAAYLMLTLAYSLGLKRVALLDTLIIAMLFDLRLIIGVVAPGLPISAYLLTFAMFFFFSLALAKRHTEILRAGPDGAAALANRGYRPADAELTLALGVASALGSLIVLVLYLMHDAFLRVPYSAPWWLWAQPLLVAIWLGRIWLLSHRGEMLDDPVSFAVRDRVSWGLAAAVGLGYLLAL